MSRHVRFSIREVELKTIEMVLGHYNTAVPLKHEPGPQPKGWGE